ncbi:hypothetical protein GCM10010492_56570 [Saccharothrix mutabilis subsp. mutabilis]|uniref:Uncharacterized protein n=1 Tax=Saccharothrix mutabilis subsp. mutabilis TaxID=66855 RepID=A0ABN0UFY8_9PSEU
MSPNRPDTPTSAPRHRREPREEGERLLHRVGFDLVAAAPEGWHRIDLKYWGNVHYGHSTLTVLRPGGQAVAVDLPPTVEPALRELRDLMYEPGAGTWFSLRYTVDPPQEYRVLFNFDRDPRWSPDLPVEAWANDQATYPRAPEHVPEWLRARLSDTSEGY